MIEVRPAQPEDIPALAPRLRAVDCRECAAWGRTPQEALELALLSGGDAWTGLVDGSVEAMFGVTPKSLMDRLGVPWMLQTDAVPYRAIVQHAPEWLARIERMFPKLENWISADNHESGRWLRRLGFTIDAEQTVIGGEPMHRFHKGFQHV